MHGPPLLAVPPDLGLRGRPSVLQPSVLRSLAPVPAPVSPTPRKPLPTAFQCAPINCLWYVGRAVVMPRGSLDKPDARSKAQTRRSKLEWYEGEFKVSLPVQGGIIDAKWRPTVTSIIRIREIGTETWSPGFETPLNTCTFVGLRPDAEYEVQVTHKHASGEGPPTSLRCTTGPNGHVSNVIPFPKR